MAIKKLESKKTIEDADIDKFIDAGGKTTIESLRDKGVKFTLRLDRNLVDRLDKYRKGFAGNISRNTAVSMAIDRFLSNIS